MSSYSFLAARDFDTSIFTPVFDTLISYLPDSIVLGTAIFGLLTLSFPLMFLFLFEIEAIFVQNRLGGFAFNVFPTLSAPYEAQQCKTGYANPASKDRTTLLELFGNNGSFPSRPLFLISSIFGYLLSSLLAFQDVIKNLDNDFQMRLTLAGVGAVFTLAMIFIYYMKGGCVGFIGGLSTVGLGAILGAVLMMLHKRFFGIESVNFLGLPTLINKTEKGSPIYVCAPNPTQ